MTIDLDIARRAAEFCVLTRPVEGATIHPRNMVLMMADEIESLRRQLHEEQNTVRILTKDTCERFAPQSEQVQSVDYLALADAHDGGAS